MAVSIPLSHARVLVRLNTFISRVPKKALGAALGAVIAGLVFIDSQAQALVVTVNSQDWEVTTFTGTYNDNASKFNTLENGGEMPWWGSETAAISFSLAVGPNLDPSCCHTGPNFIYRSLGPVYWSGYSDSLLPVEFVKYMGYNLGYTGVTTGSYLEMNAVRTWAIATLVPAASSANVPGPLPILGLAAAFGFSRKLRKRINLHRDASAVSTPPGA